jgi:hypothetical protein
MFCYIATGNVRASITDNYILLRRAWQGHDQK